jgi:riboflavin kinase/FMN adenylyltransferase
MELVRGLGCLRDRHRGGVVTIGTFDGLHRGHRALIERALALAAAASRPAMMVTFEPMPREYLHAAEPPARLANFRERWRLVEASGLDALCVMRFGERLRNLPGEAFAELIATDLGAAAVVVGHDFKFGRDGEATATSLEEAGRRYGFRVEIVPPVRLEGQRVSSSAVREALAAADFACAAQHLGRPYTMRGRVTRGERLGRTLGFPTANLRLRRRRSPLDGVFAVRVHGVAAGAWPGVSSLGTRPTVGGVEPWLETFLFDFAADLYGREIEVEFVRRLRGERRFESVEALVEQMHRDATAARSVLAA